MPDDRKLDNIYRIRAREWQARAAALPPGAGRDNCQAIAAIYRKLAMLAEDSERGHIAAGRLWAGSRPTQPGLND